MVALSGLTCVVGFGARSLIMPGCDFLVFTCGVRMGLVADFVSWLPCLVLRALSHGARRRFVR